MECSFHIGKGLNRSDRTTDRSDHASETAQGVRTIVETQVRSYKSQPKHAPKGL
jgi:hypothetical protein